MPKVIIWHKAHDGVRKLEMNVAAGLNVLIGAWQVGMDEFGFGDCGGNLVCASCHVRVKNGTFLPMKLDEQYALETLPEIFAESRLACQLKVTGDCEVEWVG